MPKLLSILTLALLTLLPNATAGTEEYVLLADPFILLYENTYYAYGTHSERGIEVYTSTDLKNWKSHNRLALDRNDSWGTRYFWAPEVHLIENKFYMYYSADEHICVAVSDTPLGPFTACTNGPIIKDEKTVDPSLFIDSNGEAYLFFVRLDHSPGIWMAEMTENRLNIKRETLRQCLSVTDDWEKVWPNVLNGPFVFCHNNCYYMLYYANSHDSQNCGIGYATASNIWGPWIKSSINPILQKPDILVGTGHCSLFTDKAGETRIAFHSHYDQANINPRKMHIGRLRFRKILWEESLTIDKSYLTPTQNNNP